MFFRDRVLWGGWGLLVVIWGEEMVFSCVWSEDGTRRDWMGREKSKVGRRDGRGFNGEGERKSVDTGSYK